MVATTRRVDAFPGTRGATLDRAMTDRLDELSPTQLVEVTGGVLPDYMLAQAYRNVGRLPVTDPAPEASLGKAGLFEQNPYTETLRSAVSTQFAQPQGSSPTSSG
jgi:hypothetical protein